jgi:hypothetical protein
MDIESTSPSFQEGDMLQADQIAAIERAMAEEHRKDLEALERLKRFLPKNGHEPSLRERIAHANKQQPQQTLMLPASENEGAGTTTIIGLVEAILREDADKGWTVPFMLKELTERRNIEMQSKKPEATLGLIFQKLVQRGHAKLVRRGAGRIPHVYRGILQEVPKQ